MYDIDASAAVDALTISGSSAFTAGTLNTILSLTTSSSNSNVTFAQFDASGGGEVTVGAGSEVVFIQLSDTQQTTITPPSGVPVVIFSGSGGVDVTFNDGSTVGGGDDIPDRVVVGTAGNDNIIIADGQDTQIILGSGDSTVVAGSGDDTIVAGLGNSTVDGGAGHNIVVMQGGDSNYHVVVAGPPASADGGQTPQAFSTAHVVVTNSVTGVTTDITGVQYVQLDGGDALIFGTSTVEAGVAVLYHTAFGRTGEAGGIEYWFDKAKAGESLHDIAVHFTHAAEFQADAAMSNGDFIQTLYQNAFGRAADTGGLAYWLAQLNSGATRADLLTQFSSVAALNLDGAMETEATIVGSVTIVHDIV